MAAKLKKLVIEAGPGHIVELGVSARGGPFVDVVTDGVSIGTPLLREDFVRMRDWIDEWLKCDASGTEVEPVHPYGRCGEQSCVCNAGSAPDLEPNKADRIVRNRKALADMGRNLDGSPK